MNQSMQSGRKNKILRYSQTSFFTILSKGLSVIFKLILIGYFLFCALFLSLRYGVLPNIDRYKSDIELMASKSIGRTLTISTVEASWQGLNPRLQLQNVVIFDEQGRRALVLPEINATLSWWSLVVADFHFRKIEIIRPSLNIRRDVDGKIFAAGFFIDPKKNTDGTGLDWLFLQQEILVRQGSVNWTDQTRSAPELIMSNVDFVLDNQWRAHKFALKAQPPLSLARPLDVRGNFLHPVFTTKISDFSTWTGVIYSDLREADLPGLKAYFDYPVELEKGKGSVRSWVQFDQGRVTDVTADVRLGDVFGQFRQDLPFLDMAQISGRLIASERVRLGHHYLPLLFGRSGHTLSLIDFSMQTRDGVSLPPTTITESFTPGENGKPETIELSAKLLDLQTLAHFAEHLPLPADQLQMLLDFSPKGQLKEFTAQWQGTYPEIPVYRLKGQFVDLSLRPRAAQAARPKTGKIPGRAAVPAIPGFENLSGSINANDKGGEIKINSTDLILQFPDHFVDPFMPFQKLQMQARWQFDAQERFLFQINKMELLQDGMSASLSGSHITSPGKIAGEQKDEIDISGKLSGFDLKQLDRYIPAQTPPDLRHWLTTAILDGRADNVTVRVKGDLAHFPFHSNADRSNRKTEFLVKGNLTGGKLNFAPGYLAQDGFAPLWPVIDNIKGSFIFDRSMMEIKGNTAKTLASELVNVKAVIPDLMSSGAILNIEGSVNGTLQSMLQYVNASPVDGWLGHFLLDTKSSASAQLGLKLQLPINHIVDSKVQGILKFNNNDIVLDAGIPMIFGVNGKLDFNEKGVNLNTLKGNMLGGPVVATGGSQKDASIRIKLDGVATADGLRKNFPGTAIERLSDKISGSSRYSAQINVKKRQTELIIDSSLQGLALNFPAPLKKLANDSVALHFEMSPVLSGDTSLLRDEIKLNFGSAIAARYQRQKKDEKNAAWQVNRGGIGVNAPPPEPDSGLSANINFKSLNTDEWRNLIGSAVGTASTGSVAVSAPLDLASYTEPSVIAVRTAELFVMGKKLDNVLLGASQQNGIWQANIDATQASGHLRWNAAANGKESATITARLAHLTIPKSAASDVSQLLEGKNSSAQIPDLDIFVENFELFNKKLGRLELLASNSPGTTGREWKIKKVSLKNDDAELSGNGKWSTRSGDSVTDLTYVLDVDNAGNLLERFGFANVMRGGRGKLDGNISWNGPPYAMHVPSMNGQLRMEMSAGQFLKVDPGAAKLLGVLSMQSLPRRLTLDFRDVFSEGFAFDGINGSAKIQQGVAKTDNIKMRSVSATVLMDGNADIAKETQDMHVAVIPEINAGAASVVYALAVNPVIGLGTFLAQLFLREPLARVFTYEYQISGPWKEPLVTKINNKDKDKDNFPMTGKPAASQVK